MDRFVDKVYDADALELLRALPSDGVDSVITDAMYGVGSVRYQWGCDPAKGNPERHWEYHQPIYDECLRVLKPGGTLAWCQSAKFRDYYKDWFGPHRIWSLVRFQQGNGVLSSGHTWIVQAAEQTPINFPAADGLISFQDMGALHEEHPCPKPPEEAEFLIKHLTAPGDIVLDFFCGLGSTLIAAKRLGRRFIGCDISPRYCQIALLRLEKENPPRKRRRVLS